MNYRKSSLPRLLALAAACGLYTCGAGAQSSLPAPGRVASTPTLAGDAQEALPSAAAMALLRAVARQLDEAARQSDFNSRAQELLKLQSARDRLENSINELCCAQQARAIELETNIDRVIDRAAWRLGPLLSATGASVGSPAPNRDELTVLAKEGEALLRNSAELPVSQRADELLSARTEGSWKQAPWPTVPPPTALSDPWAPFPSEQFDVKMYSLHF
jgi:hypothetical protein